MHYIAEDKFVPGNLLFADSNALRTTDGTTTFLIAGTNARFNIIHSFIQLSRSHIILTELHSHCLRGVDRTTNQTSIYSGNCTNRGDRNGVDALFTFPYSVIIDLMNSQQLIVSEASPGSLKTISTVSKSVSTMYRDNTYKRTYLLQDPETGDIYVTIQHGVGLYDYQGNTFSVITGSFSNGFRDGEFSKLLFSYPQGLAFLSRSTLLVADWYNHRLRVLDLTTNTSLSICSGETGHSDGHFASCKLTYPFSLLKVTDTVYVGEYLHIRSVRGEYLSFAKLIETNSFRLSCE